MRLPVLTCPGREAGRLTRLAALGLLALSVSGCLNRAPADMTGSLGSATTPEDWRRQVEALGPRFDADPGNPAIALGYARALRATEQRSQAVAVLQQAAIRNPKNLELLAAYGKALAEVGRFKEADEVLTRAHAPERPDWRILSAQGTIADQVGDHALAQRYYESALRIAPGEPTVLSNLGLSYALSKRLGEAEQSLRQAAEHANADARVRQNLALVLGLQGKFPEAEEVLRRDLPPNEAAANLAALKRMVSQPNSWSAIRRAGRDAPPAEAGQEPKG